MKIVAEEGEQANNRPPDRGQVRRRPLDDVECPLTVREAARFLASARRRCIFGLSESRFPISA